MQFWYFHPLKSLTELQTEGVQCFVFSTQSNRPWVFNVEKKMIGSRKVRLWKRFAKFGICEKYIWNEMYLAVRDWRHRKKWGVAWFKTAVRNSNACSGCLQKIVGSRYSCQLKTALNKLMEEKTIKGHHMKQKWLLSQKVPEQKLPGAECYRKYCCICTFSLAAKHLIWITVLDVGFLYGTVLHFLKSNKIEINNNSVF